MNQSASEGPFDTGDVIMNKYLNYCQERFHYHKTNSRITAERYIEKEQGKTVQRFKSSHSIYLDTNYLLMLRDYKLNRLEDPSRIELCNLIYKVKQSKNVIFPYTHTTFQEIIKQTDTLTRSITAQVVDELSQGIIIKPSLIRRQHEYQMFLFGLDPIDNLDLFIHASIGYALEVYGEFSLTFPKGWSQPDTEIFKKMIFDFNRRLTLEDKISIYTQSGPGEEALDRLSNLFVTLNNGKFQHQNLEHNYNTILFQELLSGISGFLESKGISGEPNQWLSRTLTINAMSHFQKTPNTLHLSSDRITSALHAQLRHERDQKYKPTDIFDFSHAADAVPYCKAFFTDISLHKRLCSKRLQFDKIFGCYITSGNEGPRNYLVSLLGNS